MSSCYDNSSVNIHYDIRISLTLMQHSDVVFSNIKLSYDENQI